MCAVDQRTADWNRKITGAFPNMTSKSDLPKILILNNDLPVFPGWGGIEFLHTTFLAEMVRKVGLVSLVHTSEQNQKKKRLSDSGVALYLWENPNLQQGAGREGKKAHATTSDRKNAV